MTYPGGTRSQPWVYDNAHNLASRTTVNGKTQSFEYDNRNRKTDMRWDDNADWAHYTYYGDSRLNTASNPNSTVTRQLRRCRPSHTGPAKRGRARQHQEPQLSQL